jgi:uncharacterized protein YjbI with pentapeptide repeats
VKIVKPQALSLLTRPFEHEGRCRLVVSVFAFFPFRGGPLLHESSLWSAAADALGEGGVLDEGMAKTCGEVLVSGRAMSAGKQPTTAVRVGLRFEGPDRQLDKEVYVIGDRTWSLTGASAPTPFTELPIGFDRAFGGEGFDENPGGRGAKPTERDGVRTHLLPNVENPKRLISSPNDKPAPVGLGPLDLMARERRQHVGTYDATWLKTRFPNVAEDFHWSYYNVAPLDQRFAGFFKGGETFTITGMNEEGALSGALPPLRPRVFIKQRVEGSTHVEELRESRGFVLDTVHLFPNFAAGVMVFRCLFDVAEDDASDVSVVFAAFEDPGEPKSIAHYTAVLEKRLDKKRGALAMLADGDLLPTWAAGAKLESWNDLAKLLKSEGFVYDRVERQAEVQVLAMREKAIAEGLPRSVAEERFVVPKRQEPPTEQEALTAYIEELQATAEKMVAERDEAFQRARDEARASMEAKGLDFDEVLANAQRGGPPKLDAERQIAELSAISDGRTSVDAEVLAKIKAAEEKLLEAYRRFTHFFPAAARLDEAGNEGVRRELALRRSNGASLDDLDLTGADLSGMDLRGLSLRRAMLEGANLDGANLEGADLQDATLSRASMVKTRLSGAKLARVNFGEARLEEANLDGEIDFTGACFYKTTATEVSLRGARLNEVQFLESKLTRADLTGATFEKAIFVDADLSSTDLSRASFKDAITVRLCLDGARLDGASLVGATFVEARARRASFVGADLIGARLVMSSDFSESCFDKATFRRTCMRETNFERATFVKAHMPEVDLSECNARDADFTLADLAASLLIKTDLTNASLKDTNLTSAILQKAKISSADFSGAVLFRADMAKAKGSKQTSFAGADLRQVRVVAGDQTEGT